MTIKKKRSVPAATYTKCPKCGEAYRSALHSIQHRCTHEALAVALLRRVHGTDCIRGEDEALHDDVGTFLRSVIP